MNRALGLALVVASLVLVNGGPIGARGALYAPVCGVDGKTYSNAGCAECAGVEVFGQGPCPTEPPIPCVCAALEDPVCGVDGRDFGNECLAACHNIKVDCKGTCPCENKPSCICTKEYAPVCSTKGVTYGNKCLAECEKAKIECKGECPCETEPCICTKEYAPVCSAKGVTYGNKCEANCAEAKIACKGECPCDDVVPPGEPCEEPHPLCLVNACQFATCDAYPEAKCISSCGGCVANWYIGKTPVNCDKPCICTLEYAPVCGVDGQTYGNKCGADCADVEIECQGECPCEKPCIGPLIRCAEDPCNSATCPFYPQAKCVANYCNGCEDVDFFVGDEKVDCGTPCACPLRYSPVCGENGQTYGNRCQADCASVDIICEKSCPCIPDCDPHDVVNCFVDPCEVTKCHAFPEAQCVSNYCGGCNADFYVNGALVDCGPPPAPSCAAEGQECSYRPFKKRGGCCKDLRCCLCDRSLTGFKKGARKCLESCSDC